jgi:predicted 2-oxoglutarate/Fe(II)-dependent dioxygenase YbiX|tara:strand:+ start:199 stop:732 length:534 start_codon:yes stop_codon:yes gene_type:complete
MNHLEAIVHIDNLINYDFCNEIIDSYKNFNLKPLSTWKGVNKNERNVLGCNVHSEKDSFNKIKKQIEKSYIYYKEKFPFIESNKINQIDLLKYEVGGMYGYHIDNYTDYSRTTSVIINLNNNYKGGDLVFADQDCNEIKRYNLQKGSIVFFPSNFMYPHTIEPITEGSRYSVVAWLQ